MIRLKEVSLGKLEVLNILNCDLGSNFLEVIDQCVKLKSLEMMDCEGGLNSTDHKYPALEYLKFDENAFQSVGIPEFLELNPNIRKFATSVTFLWEHQNKLTSSNIKLDHLAIRMNVPTIHFQLMFDLLNKLHERDFYQKLQWYIYGIPTQETIDQLATLNGLDKVFIHSRTMFGSAWSFWWFGTVAQLSHRTQTHWFLVC